jgi:hypothetical protein
MPRFAKLRGQIFIIRTPAPCLLLAPYFTSSAPRIISATKIVFLLHRYNLLSFYLAARDLKTPFGNE